MRMRMRMSMTNVNDQCQWKMSMTNENENVIVILNDIDIFIDSYFTFFIIFLNIIWRVITGVIDKKSYKEQKRGTLKKSCWVL